MIALTPFTIRIMKCVSKRCQLILPTLTSPQPMAAPAQPPVAGQCVGVAATVTAGEHVTLQPSGVSSKTLWIADSPASITDSFVPLINGSTSDVSDPFVLTYPAGASPLTSPPAPPARPVPPSPTRSRRSATR
jgi:hypothetical protein